MTHFVFCIYFGHALNSTKILLQFFLLPQLLNHINHMRYFILW